ncbi:hypothetical protein TSOC_003943 [Tetrabaena socialis]|uniref:Conserved oligomeric Golgi complex subunit 2 n=1 Tax=Tetrabaena socialis TaxID=47790 RepID=A0A2J8AA69_9CHLO|nr:hypothetical protein TSOC_003943 [Tetrabaena socialis]|eukprot:PNH09417.1 hypothetical protein TSOC_003943 [Tetrabaena socialis]
MRAKVAAIRKRVAEGEGSVNSVPLATLQSELNTYLATLKTKLVEVINEDYSDYVGLSGRLANVEGSVVRMRKPLLELRVTGSPKPPNHQAGLGPQKDRPPQEQTAGAQKTNS